jgi:4-diphosphocytidyl-2-C-methyl-D-erythritol kinase
MRSARLRSLAKINLDLRVLHKNADGFHEMRTVFHTISLADRLDVEFEASRSTQIGIEDSAAIPDNLVVRAARSVLDALRITARVQFRLTKNIPMGGGLGGGSSNAAAVLLALPVLTGRSLPIEKLLELAAKLGSDVPFFLLGGAAVGIGRGTEIYPLADLDEELLLVIAPDVSVSTGPAYQALNRSADPIKWSSGIHGFEKICWAFERSGSAAEAIQASANDFEASVFRQHPVLRKMKSKLSALSAGARMTGSGSAIFGLFRTSEERTRAEKELRGDPLFRNSRFFSAELVRRRKYQRLWRRQLQEHLIAGDNSWPPRSRYAKIALQN